MADHIRLRDVAHVDIRNYAAQTPTERFAIDGLLANVHDSQRALQKLPSNAKTASLLGAPVPAFWRMNLVALSQKYNMYFAAYKDTIHITIPRTLKQILPGVPDLILRLPKSDKADDGYLDDRFPHSVNNMLIGNLGNKEILLFCSDDGDVTAYYTDLLAEELQRQTVESSASSIPISSTRPFFLENVGSSAWGLAIHQKSRLIAVSSNNHEVTVFVHGINKNEPCNCAEEGTAFDPTYHGKQPKTFPNGTCLSKGFFYNSGHTEGSLFPLRQTLTSTLKKRSEFLPGTPCSRNFRIILKSLNLIHNIPAITFAEDNNGLAESIIATDIAGEMWLLGVWEERCEMIGSTIMEPRNPDNTPQMGWGVMTIPLRYFKPTRNFHDALGMQDLRLMWDKSVHNRPGTECCMNISSAMRLAERFPRIMKDTNDEITQVVRHLRVHSGHVLIPTHGGGTMEDGGNDDESDDEVVPEQTEIEVDAPSEGNADTHNWDQGVADDSSEESSHSGTDSFSWDVPDQNMQEWEFELDENGATTFTQPRVEVYDDSSDAGSTDAHYGDHKNLLPSHIMACIRDAQSRFKKQRCSDVRQLLDDIAGSVVDPSPILSDGSVILRTWNGSIELVPSFQHIPPTVCSPSFPGRSTPTAFGLRFMGIGRINMMAFIPELALVVVASQNGQAALLSLSAIIVPSSKTPVPTFRVEALLPPRNSDEISFPADSKPECPLLGLAVSPMQSGRGRGIELQAGDCPKRWRLFMQSYDHTVWTYELSRDGNDDLLIL